AGEQIALGARADLLAQQGCQPRRDGQQAVAPSFASKDQQLAAGQVDALDTQAAGFGGAQAGEQHHGEQAAVAGTSRGGGQAFGLGGGEVDRQALAAATHGRLLEGQKLHPSEVAGRRAKGRGTVHEPRVTSVPKGPKSNAADPGCAKGGDV